MSKPYFVLSLDGGGSLGVYTLGVLVEIERMLDKPLHETFELVYGTSTGAIIASMVALGDDVAENICDRYFTLVPAVMRKRIPRTRTAELHRYAQEIYREKTFDDFLINIGIVATDIGHNRPRVFKRTVDQAHRAVASFVPGFGCTIAEAVVASCAARPYFKKQHLSTPKHGDFDVIDGGFVANNPTLFAVTDALGPLKVQRERIRILSIGTGSFPPRRRLLGKVMETPTIMTLARASSNTIEILRTLLFSDIQTLRIDDAFTKDRYRTDFLEDRHTILKEIFQLGRESFREREPEIKDFFQ